MSRGAVRFSWRALKRDWRAGELRALVAALVVAVAAVTAVGFFTDRIGGAMERQAGELLAADLAVESRAPLPEAWLQKARELGLRVARLREFRSVITSGERVKLAEIKAVGEGYPLRGGVRTAAEPFGPESAAAPPPAPGRVWAAPELFQALGLEPGDEIGLGASRMTLAGVLAYEPDRIGNLFSIGPRLMMNLADLPATELIQTGSVVHYRLLFAGEAGAVERLRTWLKPRLPQGARLLGIRDARPELTSALDRAERFLGLASLVSVLLAGVAVATAARRYARRHQDSSAIMRCLGARQPFIVQSFSLQLLWLGLLAAAAGVAVGFIAQHGLALILGDLFAADLPAPGPWPVLSGLLTALVTLAGFGLPPVLALKDVSPLRVLRRDIATVVPSALFLYGAAVAALMALMLWQARDLKLAVLVFVGAALTLVVLAGAARLLVAFLGRLRHGVGVTWRFGLANLTRRPGASVGQVVAFGLGIMVLLLLSLVRGDLLSGWRETLPPDAPNHFLINVLPDQVEAVDDFLAERGMAETDLYPMVRGRLVAINEREVGPEDYEEPRAKRLIRREFNLSWSAKPPAGNEVVAGRWWEPDAGVGNWSVEEGIAETLGIAMGDTLTYRIAGQSVTGTVTNLRAVDWDSFRVNFFVVAPPGVLEEYPASYITSFYLPEGRARAMSELVKRFPNLTVIDVDAIMSRVRAIIERVTLAVEFVFVFTLLAGLTVLYAAIQSTHDQRLRESAMLRTLGARRAQVWAGLVAEFLALGALAGTLAALLATLLGYVLADYVFDLPYHLNPWLWLIGIAGGGGGVALAGLAGTRHVLARPPLAVLRRGA